MNENACIEVELIDGTAKDIQLKTTTWHWIGSKESGLVPYLNRRLNMVTALSESEPVARKEHRCDACDWVLRHGWHGMGLTFSELRSIAKAKSNNWRIVKGQKYLRQTNIQDGELRTFKAIPEIHAICLAHDYYDT